MYYGLIIKVKEPTTLNEVKEKLSNNKFISLTNKDLTSSVFSLEEIMVILVE